MKLELILRLLDNDELSAEHVNDVKDFLEDYLERNQVHIHYFFTLINFEEVFVFLFHDCIIWILIVFST